MKVILFHALILITIFIAGCAENNINKKRIETEIQNIQNQSHESVMITPREIILASPDLTLSQKEKLLKIEENNRNRYIRLTDEIERTKIVMIQTILKPEMNQKDFRILKNKLLRLDKERVENGFESIAQVRDVIAPMERLKRIQFDDSFFHDMVKGM